MWEGGCGGGAVGYGTAIVNSVLPLPLLKFLAVYSTVSAGTAWESLKGSLEIIALLSIRLT